jgi:hypothetical protein
MMGHLVEQIRLFKDMERMGIQISSLTAQDKLRSLSAL